MSRIIGQWVAAFLAVLALQGTLVPMLGIHGREPDVVFLLLFVFAIRYGVTAAIWVGFVVGLLQDLYSPAILGQNALCKSVCGMFCGMFNERVMSMDPLMKMLLLLLAFFIHDAIFALTDMLKLGTNPGTELTELLTQTLPRALYSVAVAAMVYGFRFLRQPSLRS